MFTHSSEQLQRHARRGDTAARRRDTAARRRDTAARRRNTVTIETSETSTGVTLRVRQVPA